LKIAIVDTNYTKGQHYGMAAAWLRWEAEQARGVEMVDPESAEFLLCTVSSQQGVSRLRGELRSICNKSARVILGGGGCYAPAIFDPYIDVACVGEGARFVRTLFTDGYDAACALPEAWVPGEKREVVPCGEFPWEIPPLNNTDGTVRVFGARGCKYRCLFCQTGWEMGYRPNPNPTRLQAQIDYLARQGHRVAVVTNDGAEEHARVRGQQEFVSMRLQNLRECMPLTRKQTKSVRIGVEGVSERLRHAVGKPVQNDELLSITLDLMAAGVGVRWFFIPGLPGETEADYDELRHLAREMHRAAKGAVMMNFHAFIPQPATPLSVLPLEDRYWEPFDEWRRWFFHGTGFTRRVQIVAPALYPGRLARAKESMAATEQELRRGWWHEDNPNWRVRYLAAPDRLRQVAKVYARRVGLAVGDDG
jgi:radical SAM superfamily enzyme YgiQ (UPF0313 family)